MGWNSIFSLINGYNTPPFVFNRTASTLPIRSIDSLNFGPSARMNFEVLINYSVGDMTISATPLSTFSSTADLQYLTSIYTSSIPARTSIYTGSSSNPMTDIEVYVPNPIGLHMNQSNMTTSEHKLKIFGWTNSSEWYLCYKYAFALNIYLLGVQCMDLVQLHSTHDVTIWHLF